ncbi:hypothetical protein PQX77_016848 [Marasmius sp. AFHP31]|nr:hypothetical protein PQX77_016848 [Marasmius sp. AFHP31]
MPILTDLAFGHVALKLTSTEVISDETQPRRFLPAVYPELIFADPHDTDRDSELEDGTDVIAQEDWGKFSLPKLSVEEWIGSDWEEEDYMAVQQHLCSRNYNPDGGKYACGHRYPELILGDPHNIDRREELHYLDLGLKAASSPPFTFPSVSPHVEVSNPEKHEISPVTPKEDPATHWAQPVFTKWYNSVLETLAQANTLDHSVVAC